MCTWVKASQVINSSLLQHETTGTSTRRDAQAWQILQVVAISELQIYKGNKQKAISANCVAVFVSMAFKFLKCV
jgi:hypothetical protein